MDEHEIRMPLGQVTLEGTLSIPRQARGLVVFAHGSGSSRFSPRNRFVADELQAGGLATLLMDLLTRDEEKIDLRTRHLRFDIGLLADRLVAAADWLGRNDATSHLDIGCFGSSTGGGAALVAAARRPQSVRAVVSRGGRPDLAGASLSQVRAPTLLIVGSLDDVVIELNREAMSKMRGNVKLEIVRGATHLFEEPGTLARVARLACAWFQEYLKAKEQPSVQGERLPHRRSRAET